MRHLFTITVSLLLLLIAASSCKTNEANYRAAYEVAKEKQLTGEEDIDRQLLDQQRPRPTVFGTDTLPFAPNTSDTQKVAELTRTRR